MKEKLLSIRRGRDKSSIDNAGINYSSKWDYGSFEATGLLKMGKCMSAAYINDDPTIRMLAASNAYGFKDN